MILLIVVLFISDTNKESIRVTEFSTMEECAYFKDDALMAKDVTNAVCLDLE